MKEIRLSQSGKYSGVYVALVDDKDFERVNQFNWCVSKRSYTNYAQRRVRINGKSKIQYMHSFILEEYSNLSQLEIDHISHDGLDNRKLNLRRCSRGQNTMNHKDKTIGTSKYRGVHWYKKTGKYKSEIQNNGIIYRLGSFDSEIEAAKKYDEKAKYLHGDYAYINIK